MKRSWKFYLLIYIFRRFSAGRMNKNEIKHFRFEFIVSFVLFLECVWEEILTPQTHLMYNCIRHTKKAQYVQFLKFNFHFNIFSKELTAS